MNHVEPGTIAYCESLRGKTFKGAEIQTASFDREAGLAWASIFQGKHGECVVMTDTTNRTAYVTNGHGKTIHRLTWGDDEPQSRMIRKGLAHILRLNP